MLVIKRFWRQRDNLPERGEDPGHHYPAQFRDSLCNEKPAIQSIDWVAFGSDTIIQCKISKVNLRYKIVFDYHDSRKSVSIWQNCRVAFNSMNTGIFIPSNWKGNLEIKIQLNGQNFIACSPIRPQEIQRVLNQDHRTNYKLEKPLNHLSCNILTRPGHATFRFFFTIFKILDWSSCFFLN